jgi:amino acid transporter
MFQLDWCLVWSTFTVCTTTFIPSSQTTPAASHISPPAFQRVTPHSHFHHQHTTVTTTFTHLPQISPHFRAAAIAPTEDRLCATTLVCGITTTIVIITTTTTIIIIIIIIIIIVIFIVIVIISIITTIIIVIIVIIIIIIITIIIFVVSSST